MREWSSLTDAFLEVDSFPGFCTTEEEFDVHAANCYKLWVRDNYAALRDIPSIFE